MQVPVVMTTSLGQKISTVAVQQAAGTTGATGHTTLLTNTSPLGAAAGGTNSQQKVCICETIISRDSFMRIFLVFESFLLLIKF